MNVHAPRAAARRLLAPAALALTLGASLLAAAPAQAQASRNEFAIQWTPAALANDERRSRGIAYDREFGNGWALGFSLGYGKLLTSDGGDGAYGLVRARHRFAELRNVPGLSPQLGIEYGGSTNLFEDSVDLIGVYAGVHYALAPELGLTADVWAGRATFEKREIFGTQVTESRKGNVRNVRFGLAFKF